MKKTRGGFTLIELLIVIMILGALGASMMISGSSVTASAKVSSIINNLNTMKEASWIVYLEGGANAVKDTDNFKKSIKEYLGGGLIQSYDVYVNDGVLYVGYDFAGDSDETEIKAKLAARTDLWQNVDSSPPAIFKDGTKVWMVARGKVSIPNSEESGE